MRHTFNWKSALIGSTIGAIVVLGGLYVLETVEHIANHPAPSQAALAKPLRSTQIDRSWVRQGMPKLRVAGHSKTSNGSTGIWTCEGPAVFEWNFYSDERIYVLDGQVTIDYQGKRFTLKPGDTALFLADTKAVWHVSGSLKKAFVLHEPNRAVRLYRRVFGIV